MQVDTVDRAAVVGGFFDPAFPEFEPVIIHKKTPISERKARLSGLHKRESRILGE
jgi:hypothetical protein